MDVTDTSRRGECNQQNRLETKGPGVRSLHRFKGWLAEPPKYNREIPGREERPVGRGTAPDPLHKRGDQAVLTNSLSTIAMVEG